MGDEGLRASLACPETQGPGGPFDVLRSETVPNLFAVEFNTGWQMIAGNPAALHRLAFLAGLVATRRDTVVHLPIRKNDAPGWVTQSAASPGLLDLVLAPHHLALRPKEWRQLRRLRFASQRRVNLPPLKRLEAIPCPLASGTMDRRADAATLILSGNRTAFLGLARDAACMATCERNWEALHLDHLMRGGDHTITLNFWDPRRPGLIVS